MKNLAFIAVCLTIVACSTKDSGTVTPEPVASDPPDTVAETPDAISVSEMLLDLPSSVSEEPARAMLRTLSQEDQRNPSGIYEGIRRSIGMVEMFSDMIKEVSDSVLGESNEIGVDLSEIEEGEPFIWTGEADEGGGQAPTGVKIERNDADATYDFTTTLYWANEDEQYVPGIIFSFSAAAEDAGRGEIFFNRAAMDGNPGVAHVVFDTDDEDLGQYMEVGLAGMASEDGGPTNAKVFAALDSDGIMTVKGNLYFESFGGGDNPMFNSDPRNYVFVGQADTENNLAVMQLALPPSTDTDDTETVFTDFSLSAIFSGAIGDLFANANDENICCCTVGAAFGLSANVCAEDVESCTNGTDADGCSASGIDTGTIADGVETYCLANEESEGCQNFLYVFYMTNPAYFDEDGFVGTADFNTPESGYDDLSVEGITYYSAADIAGLEIDFDVTPIDTIE